MFSLSGSELLFYFGILIMIVTIIVAVTSIIIFFCTGRRLKRKLEQEYGEPQRYHM